MNNRTLLILTLVVALISTAVPALAQTETTTCTPRPDWTATYTVQRGDTLYNISQRYDIPYTTLMNGNCLTSTRIYAGQTLRVPANEQNFPSSITITYPDPGTVVPASGTFLIEGVAQNLFEGNLVVQVLDASGNVLAEQPTTAAGAALGGAGGWSLNLSINTTAGTSGSVYAYATSPRDGSVVASSRVNVRFGPLDTCQPRTDLPVYVVQPGENLFRIALRHNRLWTTVAAANCLQFPHHIEAGQVLYIP